MRGSRWLLWFVLLPAIASASGPRFVTGPPFFTGPQGVPIGWKQTNLLYSTDPGPLSSAVDHQAANTLVSAAASVWNVSVASITISQGGVLAEHVSEQDSYLSTSGLVFPDDVMNANAAAIPIAVIYDTDGSITDLLLGSGASLPSGCRQNAVTQTIDSFDPAGYILHAIIVLNGRCTGSAPELQLEMQYQLERAFGRVLGLAWSQTNDNVFTGSPTPTHAQAMAWPIMHPLDIICGLYAYQCLPSPFQLRPDDVSSMVAVYPIPQNSAPPTGKQSSLSDADSVFGRILFPTGEGMAGVNVLVSRQPQGGVFDAFYEASAVSGSAFRASGSSPFVAPDTSPSASFGAIDPNQIGAYTIAYVPIDAGVLWQNLQITTEPVNPLYIGAYSLGPYALGAVTPSGSSQSQENLQNYAWNQANANFPVADAAPTCGNGADGTPSTPMPAPATGWWRGLLCGYGHASYIQAAVTPGRSFTIEVTALDEQGLASESKAMPVMGLFAPTDTAGSLPSLGATQSAFNTTIFGMSTISAPTNQLTSFWFGIADQRGDGRPDFAYQVRLLYADSVIPAQIGSAGGTITISGSGFRAGNAVTINGVAAKVISWTASTIVVSAPSMATALATSGSTVDIVVSDLSTRANSTMTAAFTYTSAPVLPDSMRLVSAQSAAMYVGDAAPTPFAVQVLKPDGVTPIAGVPVVFSVAAGTAQFSLCPIAACSVLTDSHGIASTVVTPQSAGAITMLATDGLLTQTASFTAIAQTGSLQVWAAPSGNVPVGVVAQTPISVNDFLPNNGGRAPGRAITFTVLSGSAVFSGCLTAVCTVTTSASGTVQISVTPTALGPISIQLADGDVTAALSFTAITNTDIMTIAEVPSASVYLGNYPGRFGVSLFLPDGVTPDYNETVSFTGPPGVIFTACGSNVCGATTGWSGTATVLVYTTQPGTYTVQAAYGAATQSVTFTVLAHTIQLNVITAPTGNYPVGVSTTVPFTFQLLQDGTIPLANVPVSIAGQVGVQGIDACPNEQACQLQTDANGMASTTVTPWRPGLITLTAVYAPYTATVSFTAVGVGESMNILQQPPPTVFVGDPVALRLQVIGPGGVVPLGGDVVLFAITNGSFGFTDWSTVSVGRQTGANGEADEFGVAWAAGPITVTASDGLISQNFNFVAVARQDQLTILGSPASGAQARIAAGSPFTVQILANDGVTPQPFRSVTVSVTNGAASFAACNGAAICQIVTDANGIVSTAVTPLAAGNITLLASEGGVQGSVSFSAIPGVGPPQLSMVALTAPIYVAAGATIPLSLQAVATNNSVPATNQAVQWTLNSGFAAEATTTVTNSSGIGSDAVLLGPLASGAHAVASACAWGNVCAQFDGFGVAPSEEAISIISGEAQLVTGGAALAPIVIRVVDAAGHPVAAAAVSIYQTASAFAVPCPSTGRCPAAATLATEATVQLSGLDGTLTVVPLAVPGTATQTEIAFSVGTQGFATVIVTSQP